MKKLILLYALLGQLLQAQTSFSIYDTLQVNHSELHFDLRDFKTGILKGDAVISVESKLEKLSFAPLLLQQMQIDSILVNGNRVDTYQYNDTLLRIPMVPALKKGEKAQLTIVYHGKPIAFSFGGLQFNDSLQMAHNMGVAISQSPHSYGRGWYPATDDFRSRTTYDLYFRVNKGMKAVGSGILLDTVPAGNQSTIWHWTIRQPIPDYLVSVAVADYRKIHLEHQQANRVLPIDIYVLPNELASAKETYSIVPAVLRVLEKHFGPYRFDRVGYVSVNSPGGAMEHVGNISMPSRPKPTMGYRELLIHELIHGWFGNAVTCASAGDMWLNEGITTYCPEVVLEELFSPEDVVRYRQSFQTSALLYAPLYEDGYRALANMPESHTYSSTVYQKGAWVIRSLRKFLGDELFFPAMKAYVDKFAFHHVTTHDFERFMSQHTGVNLSDFFKIYVYQPGFLAFEIESVSGKREKEGYSATVRLDQKRCHASSYASNFRLPLTFYATDGRSEKHYVEVNGASTECVVHLPFEPAYGIVDTEQEICKASLYDSIVVDTAGIYTSRHCFIQLNCKQDYAPSKVHLEYYHVAPDAQKETSAYRLSDTHYWRISGNLSGKRDLAASFLLDKRLKDASLLTDGVKEVTLMYRSSPAEDWKPVQTVAVDIEKRNSHIGIDQLNSGEYCLAVRK